MSENTSNKKYTAVWIVVAMIAIGLVVFGYFFLIKEHSKSAGTTTEAIYTCPMHPQVQSETPGNCPICGMTLVLKKTTSTTSADTTPGVRLTERSASLANVTTAVAGERAFVRDIIAPGTLQIPESAEQTISARIRGRIEKLYVNKSGSVITEGARLYDIYSADLLNSEKEYLILKASASHAGAMQNTLHAHIADETDLIQSARNKLSTYGLTEEQLDKLDERGIEHDIVTILAPRSGIVLQKSVNEGAYVEEGTTLFAVADLTKMWANLAVSENDMRFVSVGMPVAISATAYPNERFAGRVLYVSPALDPASHTIKVRIELDNASFKLKDQMYVSGAISLGTTRSVSIPASAVIQTGKANVVWVKNPANGAFNSREVTLGMRSPDDFFQVLGGLNAGEEIAISGTYLLDSEHQFTHGTSSSDAASMPGMDMSR
jgi:Cu(I)/Ag(I) efflux system membrane fusion protein